MKYLAVLILLAFVDVTNVTFAQPCPEAKNKPMGEERFYGLKIPDKDSPERVAMHARATLRHGYRMKAHVAATTAPAKFDCVEMGWVPPMRDQGNCGSCYLICTADALTCCFIKAGLGKADDSFKISDQYGMDCHNFGGCNGGWPAEVAEYMVKKGFPAERYLDLSGKSIIDYPPYEARARTCRLPANAKKWVPEDWGYATSDQSDRAATPAEIKAALLRYGTLVIALDAGGGFDSSAEVAESLGGNINHAITLVGWDDTKGKAGAFKVRNQWGKGWQQGGYRWIGYGAFKNVVEVIWFSAAALPPPPPPPDPTPPDPPIPPGPSPSGTARIKVLDHLAPGDYEVVPAGTAAKYDDVKKKLLEIQRLIELLPKEPPAPPTLKKTGFHRAEPSWWSDDYLPKYHAANAELKKTDARLEKRIEDIEQSMLRLVGVVEGLQIAVIGKR